MHANSHASAKISYVSVDMSERISLGEARRTPFGIVSRANTSIQYNHLQKGEKLSSHRAVKSNLSVGCL